MRILLTNDDGISADGLLTLKKSLDAIAEVVVVAPAKQQSATGHSITLHKPVRLEEQALADGSSGYACSGTPTDCVSLGLDVVMHGDCDLVFSGINSGPNLGWDVTYSGTVSAAIEGAILGVPSIAISLATDSEPYEYGPSAEFAVHLAKQVLEHRLSPYTLLNVNVPPGTPMGVSVTHQGRRQYVDRIDKRTDPWGRAYYWLCGSLKEETPDPGSDVHAVLERHISVTPIHLDLTARAELPRLRTWDL